MSTSLEITNVWFVHYKHNLTHKQNFYSTPNPNRANFCIVGKADNSTVIPKPQQTRPGKRLAREESITWSVFHLTLAQPRVEREAMLTLNILSRPIRGLTRQKNTNMSFRRRVNMPRARGSERRERIKHGR